MSNPVSYDPKKQKTWFINDVYFSVAPQLEGGIRVGYVEKTANYTLTSTDYTVNCTSGTFTITLPTSVGIGGKVYNVKNTGVGIITVDANGTQTIDGELTQSVFGGESLLIQSTGSNWIVI